MAEVTKLELISFWDAPGNLCDNVHDENVYCFLKVKISTKVDTSLDTLKL